MLRRNNNKKSNQSFLKHLPTVFLFLLPIILITYIYQRLMTDAPNVLIGEVYTYDMYPLIYIYKSITKWRQLPLWDNYLGSGISAIGHPLYHQTNPLVYLLILIFQKNFILLMRYYFYIYLIVGAIGLILISRYLKLSKLASYFGILAYVCNYFMMRTMQAGFRPDLIYITILPWAFYFLLKALDGINIKHAITAGVMFSLFIHTGAAYYTQFATVFLGGIFSIYIITYYFSRKSHSKQPWIKPNPQKSFFANLFHPWTNILQFSRSLKRLKTVQGLIFIFIVFAVSAFLFSAVKLLPVAEFLNQSSRQEFTLEEAEVGLSWSNYRQGIRDFTSGFFPHSNVGLTETKELFKFYRFVHYGLFFSIFLSLFSKHRRLVISLLFISIIAIIAAAGPLFPIDLYKYFYNLVPGFKTVRFPMRFLCFLWFTIPILSALGIDALVKSKIFTKIKLLKTMLLFGIIYVSMFVAKHNRIIVDKFPYQSYKSSFIDYFMGDTVTEETSPFRHASDLRPYSYNTEVSSKSSYDSIRNIYNDARPYFYDVYRLGLGSNKDNTNEAEKLSKRLSIVNAKYILRREDITYPESSFKNITKDIEKLYGQDSKIQVWEVPNARPRLAYIPNGTLYFGNKTPEDEYYVNQVREIIYNPEFDVSKNTVFTAASYNDYLKSPTSFDILAFSKKGDSDPVIKKPILSEISTTESQTQGKIK